MRLKYILAAITTGLPCLIAGAQEHFPLTRDKCREMAIANSRDIRISENGAAMADLDRQAAKTGYLPDISASATGLYATDMDMMGMTMMMRGTYMAGLTLVQPVYAGGKIIAGNKLAELGQRASGESLRLSRQEIIANADNAYWTYVSVRGKVAMLENYTVQLDTLLAHTQSALETGMATYGDLLKVKAHYGELQYQLQKARNGKDMCCIGLCNMLGLPEDTVIEPADTELYGICPVPAESDIENRPEYRMLELNTEIKEKQIAMTRADYLPSVGLMAGYARYGNIKINSHVSDSSGGMVPYAIDMKDGLGFAMLSVKIPIFHFGEGRKKIRKARIEYSNAVMEKEKNVNLMKLEIISAYRNVTDACLMISMAEDALAAAEESLRVTRNRHEVSMDTLTDLLDAQAEWQKSASNLIEAKTQYRIYLTQYEKAAGLME